MAKRRKYQDWRGKAINFCSGCSNACLYCYVTDMGCKFKWATLQSRNTMVVRSTDVKKKHDNYGVQVMVPSSHDITPQVLEPAIQVISNLLAAGNERILIVSKPYLECVKAICKEFASQKDKFLLRFTIGSLDDEVLSFWEPGATKVQERLQCLAHAHSEGFATSVSVEPMLDYDNIEALVDRVSKHVNHTIWLGLMNPKLYFLKKNLGQEFNDALDRIYANQTVEKLSALYEKFQSNPLIRFTGSIREKLNLELLQPEYVLT